MIKKLLIANRGEIARRIDRTCKRLGIATATVHSLADRNALHVRTIGESIAIGAAAAAKSYLNIEAILGAARKVGADAVHPGIGFLSEDPNFAEAVEAAGLIFVGPRPETMRRFSDKWAAKREARDAGVPVIGGSEGSSTDAAKITRLVSKELALPVVLKAAAGGGGRGVRVVRTLEGLQQTIESAMREAKSSFGRPDLIVEQFVEHARHLEVQVVGDGAGAATHLFERECSLQRRFQKIIEEAPAVHLDADVRERLLADAVRLAASVNYRNVGTMEFLVSGDDHFFLECNPRLQVEHTVTEEITGVDLVEVQLSIAANSKLPFKAGALHPAGHAIQARVYAEDCAAGFLPSTGVLTKVAFPEDAHLRVETGVEAGSEISSHYDPMIAKLIVCGADRADAIKRLSAAIDQTIIFGVETNLSFLKTLLSHPTVQAGEADNRFIDREFSEVARQQVDAQSVAIAASILVTRWAAASARRLGALWGGVGRSAAWKYTTGVDQAATIPGFYLTANDGAAHAVSIGRNADGRQFVYVGEAAFQIGVADLGEDRWSVNLGDHSLVVEAIASADSLHLHGPFGTLAFSVTPFLSLDAASASQSGAVRAPMMGVITKVIARAGDEVRRGDVIAVQESMKMEMRIEATCDGSVAKVNCAEGSMVERNQVLAEITPNA